MQALDIHLDGDFVDLRYHLTPRPFSRIRRITGYLVGDMSSFHMRRSHYTPGQTICTYGEGGGEVGVLLRGRADLVRYDYGGTRTILERIETGGGFGEVLAFTPELGDCVEVAGGNPERQY